MWVSTILRPTTLDLAKAAGVSRATVDRVLNGRDGVKKRTVERVNAAIEELGFVRNLAAANLAKRRTYRFLFILPESGDQFLDEILKHIREADAAFAADMVKSNVRHIDDNDPHTIAALLSSLSSQNVDGVAIYTPEHPQVRDAILRLQERGVHTVPFISNQTLSGENWVGIDDRAAGATAATLMGRFLPQRPGKLALIAESVQSRASLERRLGFDDVINESFAHLEVIPTLETYGIAARAESIISSVFAHHDDIVGVYILASEARGPLTALAKVSIDPATVVIAHERTPTTEAALSDGTIDAVITQDPGHLVRSAIRKLRAKADGRETLSSQERIRTEILLKTNL